MALPESRKNHRLLSFPESVVFQLERRKQETDAPVSSQIRRAVEAYLQTPHENMHRLLTGPRESRTAANIPDTIWDALKERKRETGLDLNEQVQIAVSLYLQSEAAPPDTAPPAPREIPPPSADEEARLNQLIEDKVRAAVAAILPPKTGTLEYLRPSIVEGAPGMVALRMLATPPCGPWKEAIEEAESYWMGSDMAHDLGVRPGDFLVRADGQSMVEAGIPDGALVLMRPLNGRKPEVGAAVLVQIATQSGSYFGTIKKWRLSGTGNPDLRDGRNLPYELPHDVASVEAVAVMVGIIARR